MWVTVDVVICCTEAKRLPRMAQPINKVNHSQTAADADIRHLVLIPHAHEISQK